MAQDRFANNFSDPTQSGRNGFIVGASDPVVPSNTEELPYLSRQLRVIEDGDVEFVFAGYTDDFDGETPPSPSSDRILIENVPAGTELNYAVRYITDGTTARILVVY